MKTTCEEKDGKKSRHTWLECADNCRNACIRNGLSGLMYFCPVCTKIPIQPVFYKRLFFADVHTVDVDGDGGYLPADEFMRQPYSFAVDDKACLTQQP